jgi:hypothetical protein
MPTGGPAKREFGMPRPETGLDISFGGEVRLLGYDMAPVKCEAAETVGKQPALQSGGEDGCWLELVLYWRAEQEIEVDYTVFVHVVGGDGQILAQRDAPPDNGAYPTSRWAAGEVVADSVRVPLPSDLPGGLREVMVGMYDPDTAQRLPVWDDEGKPVDDKVVLKQGGIAAK